MYTLILAEAALERIPRALWKHASVRRYAVRRGKPPRELLLDLSYHYAAMRSLREREKRGRPDIVHFCLLEALGSPLAKAGLLRVFVHSREGISIRVAAETRLPRNYERFLGLFEQVLKVGKAPPKGEPLLTAKEEPLAALIQTAQAKKNFLLNERASRIPLRKLAALMHQVGGAAILVGAFPRGDFSRETLAVFDSEYSIYPEPLEAWTVVSRILGAVEDQHSIFG